jgi:hypothetical protein
MLTSTERIHTHQEEIKKNKKVDKCSTAECKCDTRETAAVRAYQ